MGVAEATEQDPQRAPGLTAEGQSQRRGPTPRTVLAVASLGAAVAFIDATIVNIAFPDIERSFRGTSISSLSWVLNAYNIIFAAFLVAFGRVADLVGRRRMFVLGLEVFTVASLLCAVAPSANALIAFRLIQALGAALLVPCSLALVLNAFAPGQRHHGVALLSAVAAGSAGLGPSLGGLLVSVDNWRLVFLVNIPIGIAAVWLARRHLVESRAPGRRRMPDVPGAFLFALAIAALVLGVVKGQEWGWTGPRVLGSFAAAVVFGAVFIWRCTWHRAPIVDLTLLRIRTFSAANAMTVIASAGFYGYTLTNVLFLTGIWQYSVLQAGLALTPGPFVAAAVAGPTSRLVARLGPRPVLVAGGLIWGGAVLWLVEEVGTKPAFLSEWLPGIILLGVGAGTLLPNLSATAVASAPGESFATATGLNSVARQVGAALGVALVVAIIGTPSPLDAPAAFQHAWTFGAVCLFVAGLGCLLVGRIQSELAPALGDSARLVLAGPIPSPRSSGSERARRAIALGPAAPAPARVQSTAEFLALVPIFAGLPAEQLQTLAGNTGAQRLEAGAWLFREGEEAEAMYVVRTGRLDVIDEKAGTVLRALGRGDVVGELALITASTRSASVRAARASDLISIERESFEALLRASPELSRGLNRVLGEQLQQSRGPLPTSRARPTTVALVALDAGVPAAHLARGLGAALGSMLNVVMLDAGETQPSAGEPAGVYAPRLDRAEAGHDLVLLAGGDVTAADPWTEFCLQQGDRILAVSSGGPVADAVRERRELRGCDLVGYNVVPGSGRLTELATTLTPIETHSLRSEELEADLARMGRRLSGRSVGVVLSGGGARAFSHIGVLEELTAAGLQIDRVLGVSMGAYIGALFALGMDADEMDARCFEEWVQRRPLGDFTVPRHGLIRGERVKEMLRRSFGELAIEELTRSFMCGYAELRSASLVLARTGPLWEQVGLSINIPILSAPQVRGRDLFIDGSLIDNLPVRAMADLAEGPVIAVDVKTTFERPPDARPSAPRRDPDQRPPGIGETLTRVLLLASANTSDAARRHADLIIKPHSDGVGLLEFHQLDTAREAGRRAAQEALANLPAGLFA